MTASPSYSDRDADRYDRWYDDHHWVFQSEIFAIQRLLPHWVKGVEIGVGSGRFARAFGIPFGIDPSLAMLAKARGREIKPVQAVAEALPLVSGGFDLVLTVTTLCFLADVGQALREIHRILREGGHLVIGFIDRLSPLGERYTRGDPPGRFLRGTGLYTPEEISERLTAAGFSDLLFLQTLFRPLEEITAIEPVKNGFGMGSFVVIRSMK